MKQDDTITLSRVAYDRLGAFPDLFVSYCRKADNLEHFFDGDFQDPEAWNRKTLQTLTLDRDRNTLADVLLEQNVNWGLDDAVRDHIEALRSPDSLAVVTGQQLGLFGGPLYTIYKTVTAIQLAQRLEAETGRTVVPVFWLEGEDHDLDEAAGVHILRTNETVSLRYEGHTMPEQGNLGPVGRLAFTDDIARVVDKLDDLLPPTDFKPQLMERIRDAYRPGRTFLDAFARLMRAYFPNAGLVFLSPDHPELKRLATPLFRRELDDFKTSESRLNEVSADLESMYHAQVQARPLNLFLVEPDGRYGLDPDGSDAFTLRGTARGYAKPELSRMLDEEPERFSPNVVMRPLMQDWLLPTVAYIAGPGEVSYFAQFKSMYNWAGIPMPIIFPRASITLVEGKIRKVLDQYNLSLADLSEPLDMLFKRLVMDQMDVDVEAAFKDASKFIHQAVNQLKPIAAGVDATLGRTAESTRAAFMKELNNFKQRVIRSEKRNQDIVRQQLEKAQVNLFPTEKMQERSLSVVYFLNKYGPDLPDRWIEQVMLDTSQHQVIDL